MLPNIPAYRAVAGVGLVAATSAFVPDFSGLVELTAAFPRSVLPFSPPQTDFQRTRTRQEGAMRKMSGAIAVGLVGTALLFAAPAATAQNGAALFASSCSGCHNDVKHPKGLGYNAAGNVAIIEAVNALGMGATGSLADHISIATYLDSVKPTIDMAPVAHNSPGTVINLRDIIVSAAEAHADWLMIAKIVTVAPPTKGTVFYQVANGFAVPSFVTYTPFPGQSGTDTWTYQGNGPGGTTTIRTATVKIAEAEGTPSGSPDLNQHGLTGSWYNPATSGQGLEVEVFPDLASPGNGLTQASWFTYDATAGAADRQRWYTLSGPVVTGQPTASLTIYQNVGGNFNAPPTTSATAVGTATLSFDTCTTGQLSYTFTDGSGRSGNVPLSRLTQNMTCATTTARSTNADFALSGNWYDAAKSGQGFTVEVNPNSRALFFAWYTYAPNGAGAGAAGQRWYTGQAAYTPGARSIPAQLYETTGGMFNASTPAPATVVVGSGTLVFQSCSSATLNFTFTGGSSSGASGTITLGRIGPVPTGCTQ
jgi:mono/diheme cytochrome c family protein